MPRTIFLQFPFVAVVAEVVVETDTPKTPPTISSHAEVSASANKPPASVPPSPANSVLHGREGCRNWEGLTKPYKLANNCGNNNRAAAGAIIVVVVLVVVVAEVALLVAVVSDVLDVDGITVADIDVDDVGIHRVNLTRTTAPLSNRTCAATYADDDDDTEDEKLSYKRGSRT
jgi:hypothetical protein